MIGRRNEQLLLQTAMDSPEAEFIAVCGRRRVGKTYLIREFFKKDLCFQLTGMHEANAATQLKNFALALGEATGTKLPLEPPTLGKRRFIN